MKFKKILIAGPCALESREQLRECVRELKVWGVPIIRASLWKPRTLPIWDGVGEKEIFTLLEETLPHGMIPATEVLLPEHARKLVKALSQFDKKSKMLIWLGARNQNHLIQQEVARIISKAKNKIYMLCKNQMWKDQGHWESIMDHATTGGIPHDQFLFCHRGFAPDSSVNLNRFRNIPDFEMAMEVKKKKQVSMILDPSHIGGNREKTIKILEQAQSWDFDGYMIEVHSNPSSAKTDRNQQLSLTEFSFVMEKLIEKEKSFEVENLGRIHA